MAQLIERNGFKEYSKQTAELLQPLPESYTVYSGAARAMMGSGITEFVVVGPTGIFSLQTAQDAGRYKGPSADRYLFFSKPGDKSVKQVKNPLNAAVTDATAVSTALRKNGLGISFAYAAYFPNATEEPDITHNARVSVSAFTKGQDLLAFILKGGTALSADEVAAVRRVIEALPQR